MAFSKYFNLFATIRTLHIAVVLNNSKNRNIHLLRHSICLLHDHLYKILRRCNDHNAINRKRLEYCQRNITCSRWHINEKIIKISPHNICPELLYNTCDHWSPPDNRCFLVFQKKIDRHDLCSVCCFTWKNSLLSSYCHLMKSVHLWDRWTCNICIHDTNIISFCSHHSCKGCCHE